MIEHDYTPGRYAFWRGYVSGFGFGCIESKSRKQIKVVSHSDYSRQKDKHQVLCTVADKVAADALAEKLESANAECERRVAAAYHAKAAAVVAAIAKATGAAT